jgi:hypothetical protein
MMIAKKSKMFGELEILDFGLLSHLLFFFCPYIISLLLSQEEPSNQISAHCKDFKILRGNNCSKDLIKID